MLGYLFGSIPSGYLAGKWLADIDLREIGSGSTGATNVLRHVGKKASLIVFIFDVSKGILAVSLANSLNLTDSWIVATGLASISGHIWPVWLKWKGGKAVATALGVMVGISWQVGLSCLGIFLIVLSISRIVSLSSIIAAVSLPILMLLSFKESLFSHAYLNLTILTMIIVLWRHRSNLRRIIEGKEPQIGRVS